MISICQHLLKSTLGLTLICIACVGVSQSQVIEEVDVNQLNGNNGFIFPGTAALDLTGASVSSAGDINADGLSDIVIGAYGANLGATDTGVAYVVFGSSQGFNTTIEVSDLDGSNGFVINSTIPHGRLGWSVSDLGDINSDSIDDLMVCAPFTDITGFEDGACYVLFGNTLGFPANFNLNSLNGSNGFKIKGAVEQERAGISSSSAGDFNADGIADILIATESGFGHEPGSAYIVFGRASNNGFSAELELSALDGNDGIRVTGLPVTIFFADNSASNAGDLNGDGIDDVIIGLPSNFTNVAYVIFGHSGKFASSIDVSELDGSNGFSIENTNDANFGVYVSGGFDINHDGTNDVMIGSMSNKAYVILGNESPFNATFDLSSLDGSNGFTFTNSNSEFTGWSTGAVGDMNADGFIDVMIGTNAGSHGVGGYIYYGHENVFPATIELSAITAEQGLKILSFPRTPSPPGGVQFNGVVADTAGDVNGDGISDLVYGQYGTNLSGNFSGAAAVLFGRGDDLIFRDGFE